MDKKTLTTYEIAQHCQVTPRTVIQWINEGKLLAFRTPGNHSRVTMEDFLAFLNKYNMPIPEHLKDYGQHKRKRILIVDDDKSMVQTVQTFLKDESQFEFELAYDGFEAGQKYSSFKPDLIVLDINMPGLDGYKLCSRIRGIEKNMDVKIMFISIAIDADAIEQMKEVGADDFLAKPFNVFQLRSKVLGLLGKQGNKNA